MYNPWAGYRVTGNWYAHRTYSYGGTDYPLGYGTELRAPASGTLTNNGWVGSAGRRATLKFDRPVKRQVAASKTPMYGGSTPYYEHNCDMVSLVFQHAKGYLGNGWYPERALIGFSGASANGKEWGGDVHLHVHGLCIHGQRVDWLKFQGSTTSIDNINKLPKEFFTMKTAIVSAPNGVVVMLTQGRRRNFKDRAEYNKIRDNIAALTAIGATDAMPLPPLTEVPSVTWDVHNLLCDYLGAPKG